MKHIKKLLSLAMALAMVMALGVSASATTFKGVEGHTYSVYTIFTADTADDGSLKNFEWGSNIVPATFIRNLQTLTVGSGEYAAFGSHFADLTAESSADDVAQAISNAKAGNNDASVAALVSAAAKDAREGVPGDLTKDYGPGYYLLEDTTSGVTGANYAVYEINGNTPNTLQITDKTDTPSPEKRVHANDGSNVTIGSNSWGYAADYRVGDYVPYKLSTVVTEKYTTADVYTVTFRDKMDDGLTFINNDPNHPFEVYIVSADGTETKVAASAYDLVAPTNNATFALTINLKSDSLKNIVSAGDSIVVTYYARLNEDAVLGDAGGGNKNHVDLDWTVDDESGTTPGDDVTVFTFQLVADKVDGNGNPLSGAAFELQKLINGVWTAVDEAVVGDAADGTVGTKFTFNTLDSGMYRLVETKVPDKYNKADDFYFEVAPEYNPNQANTTLNLKIYAATTTDEGKTVTRGAEITEGILQNNSGYNTQVVNNQGLTLPSTGGIGTTIFYIVGGLLVAGAVILLITKRRMNLSED